MKRISSLLMLLSVAAAAGGQDLSATLPQDPQLIKGKFANGLTYYVRPNHKPENKVELRLVVKTGSIMEDEDQLGLAHFMEHMNFNGLRNFQKNELVSYLQSIGVQFGADLNAYTSFDQTVFILPIPTDKPGNLEKGFQIIEDWAHNALLTDKDINEERAVVLEESRLGKGAQDRMLKQYFPKYASGTKYAERLPIGKDEILHNFKPDAIRRFYSTWYRPDLQAVAVVGDIDTATAMSMLRKHFGSLQNPKSERERTYVSVNPRTKPEAMVVTDKEATNSMLLLIFPHQKEQEEKTVGDYRRTMTRQLALQMLNRRYQDLSQGANPPFPFAGAEYDNLIHGYEAFTLQAVFNDDPKKPLDALTAELLKANQFGFSASELDLAKKDMQAGMERTYNERNTTESADYVEEYIRNFLSDEPAPGIENEYGYYKNLLPGITLAEVNAYPRQWLSNTNTFTLITAPDAQKSKLPSDQDLLSMTQSALKQTVAAEQEKTVASSLMTAMPTAGKVVTQKENAVLGATTYTLSNGVNVTIKPTTFKSDEIIIKGVRKGGTNNYSLRDHNSAQMATDVVDAMGIATFSPTDLKKVMSGKTAEANFDIGQITASVDGKSSIQDFETALQLVYLGMTQPRRDEDLYKAYVTKQKQMLQFMSANPQMAYIDTTVKVLYNNNPLAPRAVPRPSDFDNINLDDALRIYKEQFGSANGWEFYLVGNIDPKTALPLIETYLGSLPQAKETPAFKDNGVRPITGNTTLKVHKGKEKQSLILAIYNGEVPYSEDMALKAQAVAEILNIKVIEELREKLGGIYTGGYQASLDDRPYPHYSIIMQLPCGPENVDKLLTAADNEIKLLKLSGPDQKDLDKVRTQWHEKHLTSVKENSYWATKMQEVLFWGRDAQHVVNYDDWANKLTPADIQDAAKKLFNGQNEFVSILYPETADAAKPSSGTK